MGAEPIDIVEVCRRYGPMILRRCSGLLGDRDEAEDAAQEVFLILLRKGDQFRAEAQIGTWIYRVTTNHCLNWMRSGRRRVRRESSADAALWSNLAPADPYESLATRARFDELLRKLDRLDQEILVYRYLDGMTQEEIAAATGKSRRTIGKRLMRIGAIVSTDGERPSEPANAKVSP